MLAVRYYSFKKGVRFAAAGVRMQNRKQLFCRPLYLYSARIS